jgi:hypothetical protein
LNFSISTTNNNPMIIYFEIMKSTMLRGWVVIFLHGLWWKNQIQHFLPVEFCIVPVEW